MMRRKIRIGRRIRPGEGDEKKNYDEEKDKE